MHYAYILHLCHLHSVLRPLVSCNGYFWFWQWCDDAVFTWRGFQLTTPLSSLAGHILLEATLFVVRMRKVVVSSQSPSNIPSPWSFGPAGAACAGQGHILGSSTQPSLVELALGGCWALMPTWDYSQQAFRTLSPWWGEKHWKHLALWLQAASFPATLSSM